MKIILGTLYCINQIQKNLSAFSLKDFEDQMLIETTVNISNKNLKLF